MLTSSLGIAKQLIQAANLYDKYDDVLWGFFANEIVGEIRKYQVQDPDDTSSLSVCVLI